MSNKRAFRMAITEVLIDHAMELDKRRATRMRDHWPDESDIYTATIIRLRVLFKKQLETEGWTPPAKKRRPPTSSVGPR